MVEMAARAGRDVQVTDSGAEDEEAVGFKVLEFMTGEASLEVDSEEGMQIDEEVSRVEAGAGTMDGATHETETGGRTLEWTTLAQAVAARKRHCFEVGVK